MRAESLIKLSKKVSSYSEENTRVLEKLDSLSLSDRGPEVRSLRKSLVDHLNVSNPCKSEFIISTYLLFQLLYLYKIICTLNQNFTVTNNLNNSCDNLDLV